MQADTINIKNIPKKRIISALDIYDENLFKGENINDLVPMFSEI